MQAEGARCPVGGEKIDESSARINGTFVVVLLVIALFTSLYWVLALLAVDFAVKVFASFKASPICKAAGAIANAAHLERVMVDSAPKRFAAVIGFAMSVAGFALGYFGFDIAFYAVTVTFLLFASLEAFVGFCTGCYIYSHLPERASRVFVKG